MRLYVLCGVETCWIFTSEPGWLEKAAKIEKLEGWASAKLAQCLRVLKPGGGRLDLAQEAKLDLWMQQYVVRFHEQAEQAAKRGQKQARACLGAYGAMLAPEFDATTQAATQIGKWLSAYANFPQSFQLEWTGKTKARSNAQPSTDAHCQALEAAVKAAHKSHPEWPVSFAGVVRLHPRAKRPTTCVAAVVTFEGHPPLSILWQAETS